MEKSKKKKRKKEAAERGSAAADDVVDAAPGQEDRPDHEEPSAQEQTGRPEESAAPASKQEDEALEMRLLRLQADFDNYRKRMQRERGEWQRQAKEALLKDILPVLDHYELGLNTAVSQHVEQSVIDGFRMVYNQFDEALRKNQVTPIEAEGETFDHNLHEAITFVPSDEHPAQTVIAQTRRGYLYGDTLLRPAQVVVSSGPAESEAAESGAPMNEEEQER